MHRRDYIHKAAIVVTFCLNIVCCAPVVHAQANDLHDAAAQLTKKLHDDSDVQKISGEHIVVAPFENINGKGDAVSRILQEMFTTDFIKAKHFKVLERDQLQSALDELHFQLSDLADPAKAKKIGKLAGATYVLLGSIADTGASTSINARIVSIESGESVAAEDVDIKTGDTTLAAGGVNPTPESTSAPDTVVPDAAPAVSPSAPAPIDLKARANPTSAGQFTGKKDEFGLLGGTNFQIAWRENLGKEPIVSFAAGDVLGNGSTRLVLEKGSDNLILSVQKWSNNRFDQVWASNGLGDYGYYHFVRLLPQDKMPSLIFVGSSGGAESLLWEGSTYAVQQEERFCVFDSVSTLAGVLVCGSYGYLKLKKHDADDSAKNRVFSDISMGDISPSGGASDAVAADFDGDGHTELAVAQAVDIKLTGKPIEIYSLAGIRKAVTAKGYGGRLAVWNPTASKHPFLVARRNTADADGKPNGGFVYFIKWNGESYDEVWKSNQIGDNVIDMQVCDPKGEGKTGLVVLSNEKNNYFLTKIVLAK